MGCVKGKQVAFLYRRLIEIDVMVLCLLFNALLAGAEMAFVAVSKPSLRELVRQKHKKKQRSFCGYGRTLKGRLRSYKSALHWSLRWPGAVSGAGAEEQLSPSIEKLGFSENTADTIAIGIVVLPLTYLTVVIGELVPKTLALKNSLGFALAVAPWLSLFDKTLGPLVTLLEWSTKGFLNVLSFLPGRSHVEAKAEDSLQGTIELDMLSSQHRQYVMNLVDLERKQVRDIFLPWAQVVKLYEQQSARDVETTILAAGHTRLPVLKGDSVVGILNAKSFLRCVSLEQKVGNR